MPKKVSFLLPNFVEHSRKRRFLLPHFFGHSRKRRFLLPYFFGHSRKRRFLPPHFFWHSRRRRFLRLTFLGIQGGGVFYCLTFLGIQGRSVSYCLTFLPVCWTIRPYKILHWRIDVSDATSFGDGLLVCLHEYLRLGSMYTWIHVDTYFRYACAHRIYMSTGHPVIL